jgi:hypothetical protein
MRAIRVFQSNPNLSYAWPIQIDKRNGRYIFVSISVTTLLRQLRNSNKKSPRKVEARLAAADIRDLQTWPDSFVDEKILAEVGIPLD